MKKLKTIKFLQKGNSLSNIEMGHILGGDYYAANKNAASNCTCSGSTNTVWPCNNNDNKATSCSCEGNENNLNKQDGCACGGVVA